MGRYRPGIETRDRILGATRGLLGELGLEAVTLKAITDRARVGPGSFYNLFRSKEEAIFEVVREAIAAVDPDPGRAGTDTVDALVGAFVAFVTQQSAVARIYLQLAVAGGLTDPQVAARVRRSHAHRVDRFARALANEHPDRDATVAAADAEVLVSSLTGLALTWLLVPDFDLPGAAERLRDRLGR